MKRTEMVAEMAKRVAYAADYARVGTHDVFGEAITAEMVTSSVRARVKDLAQVLSMTDAEWSARWAASEAEVEGGR